MLDADAWIYPEVYSLVQRQWEWLAAQLPLVNRSEYPWLLVVPHRALYCTKVADDGECNSEAEALRYGGWLHQWIDIYDVTPQQGFDALAIGGSVIPEV